MIDEQHQGERRFTEPLATEKIIVDRKVFFLDLKENARGRFMKITEDVGGRRDTILLPAEAFEQFASAFLRLCETGKRLGPAVED